MLLTDHQLSSQPILNNFSHSFMVFEFDLLVVATVLHIALVLENQYQNTSSPILGHPLTLQDCVKQSFSKVHCPAIPAHVCHVDFLTSALLIHCISRLTNFLHLSSSRSLSFSTFSPSCKWVSSTLQTTSSPALPFMLFFANISVDVDACSVLSWWTSLRPPHL